MSGCTIISAGFYSTLQDEGRRGYRHWGIPVSGPMDRINFDRANTLLGNTLEKTSIECTLEGPILLCNQATKIAVTGAPMPITKNDQPVSMNAPISCELGDILSFGKMTQGMRSYIAFSGGLQTPLVLGSRSYYKPVSSQAKLRKGQILPLNSDQLSEQNSTIKIPSWDLEYPLRLRVSKGPDWEKLPLKLQQELFEQSFTVGSNNRMGYQLEGQHLEHELDLPSAFVLPGTVQLTPKGNLLIAMADGQVTGGYPRILVLEVVDIGRLAQARTGKTLTLQFLKG